MTQPAPGPASVVQTGNGSEHRGAQWALLYGNFTIGCGVMVIAGALNDLVSSLQVSIALGGQLIAVAAVMMALGAPLLAAVVAGIDRRRLLTWSLVWFALGHALSALMPNYAALLPIRALSVLGAAVFTPQAAAAIGVMVPAHQRGRAITFVFLGWSVSSVLGMPLHAYIGDALGWRYAFGLVALLALAGAWWVWQAMPDGVRPAALSRAHWRQVFTSPVLMAIVAVTALSAAGQFTLFSYLAAYYRQVLGASASQISLLFLCFGVAGVIGNVLLSRRVDRIGADSAVAWLLVLMAVSFLAWPLGTSVPLVLLVAVPWALGCFSSNSAQQARLSFIAPPLTPALVALNSSAMYVGQALGATSGGAVVAQVGFGPLHWIGLGWMVLALGLSLWATKRVGRDKSLKPAHG
jgi:predicted MFS family arabinose efflux permease